MFSMQILGLKIEHFLTEHRKSVKKGSVKRRDQKPLKEFRLESG